MPEIPAHAQFHCQHPSDRIDAINPEEMTGYQGARLAATVLLVRDGARGLEVFAQERVSTMQHFPGITVFPGGGVDHRDFPARSWNSGEHWCGPSAVSLARRMETNKYKAHALVFAAVRELFEEAGALLAVHGDGSPITNVAPYSYARRCLESHEIALSDLMHKHDLKVRSDLLRPWARWVGKSYRRQTWFDTFSFVARVPNGQRPAPDPGGEADDANWFSPQLLLDGWRAGLVRFVLPTWAQLNKLAGCKTVADVMRCADDTVIHPIVGKGWEDPAYREFLEYQPADRIGKLI